MPNWCENIISITGDKDAIAEFAKDVSAVDGEGESVILSFDAVLPTPPEMLKGEGWYDWRLNNWGTKWDANEPQPNLIPKSGELNPVKIWQDGVYFLTAWSPPTAFVFSISHNYPELTFWLKYYEGGMCFAGYDVIKNGEVLEAWDANPNNEGYEEFREKHFNHEEDTMIF